MGVSSSGVRTGVSAGRTSGVRPRPRARPRPRRAAEGIGGAACCVGTGVTGGVEAAAMAASTRGRHLVRLTYPMGRPLTRVSVML